jgi:hypothetical protein
MRSGHGIGYWLHMVDAAAGSLAMQPKIGTYINAHKVMVVPVVLALMWQYDNWSPEAYIYLAPARHLQRLMAD